MKTIKIEPNQSLRDVAVAHYGTLEALGELLAINFGGLRNDKAALVAAGIDYLSDTSFYLDVALEVGLKINIDDQSKIVKQAIIGDITTPQTKYEN